jgi:hypothetical protein
MGTGQGGAGSFLHEAPIACFAITMTLITQYAISSLSHKGFHPPKIIPYSTISHGMHKGLNIANDEVVCVDPNNADQASSPD